MVTKSTENTDIILEHSVSFRGLPFSYKAASLLRKRHT